ncbi:ferritin-like domain-containing protein [Methylacidimicrobium tartarophylax]|uniref:ferritin-like domain-containing protein n=1 Tax=Methylacidimicrobium tartarophylax TaxID=1041768 RepID=UPI001FE69579|nr:DUF2202 domain-containing protein [Methylacidimicrobium tartarophylax]
MAEALDDEYKTRATYARVIEDFGGVRAFVNIVEAEKRYISALLGLFERYDIAPPSDRWTGAPPRFLSLLEACNKAVQAETDNVAIYDRVLKTSTRADILSVYHAWREASLDRHLPAFRRCAERKGQ